MLAQGRGLARGVAGRAGGSAWVMLYKLPCSISLSAPAMTLSGIELSANGSIRPKADPQNRYGRAHLSGRSANRKTARTTGVCQSA
jgi:hypothetical protein